MDKATARKIAATFTVWEIRNTAIWRGWRDRTLSEKERRMIEQCLLDIANDLARREGVATNVLEVKDGTKT